MSEQLTPEPAATPSPTSPTTSSPGPELHRSGLFNTKSDRLPDSLAVRLMRIWIPLALCIIGVILLVADDFNGFGVSAFACFVGAGSSTWLINFLWRLGISGDDERDVEAKDREYLAKNGHWPDEDH
jgi:hypothetical protein